MLELKKGKLFSLKWLTEYPAPIQLHCGEISEQYNYKEPKIFEEEQNHKSQRWETQTDIFIVLKKKKFFPPRIFYKFQEYKH